MAKLPNIHRKHKICIVCEGFEDKAYIDRLLELKVFLNHFEADDAKWLSELQRFLLTD